MKSLLRCLRSFGGGIRNTAFLAALVVALLLLSSSAGLRAQGLSGITGTITDDSGAVVPNASVTVTNAATNVVHKAVTTSEGTYFITDLIPGTYTVKVEKSGFQTGVVSGVNVYANQSATANASLKTGATTSTVEVIAPAITLETEQPNLDRKSVV